MNSVRGLHKAAFIESVREPSKAAAQLDVEVVREVAQLLLDQMHETLMQDIIAKVIAIVLRNKPSRVID